MKMTIQSAAILALTAAAVFYFLKKQGVSAPAATPAAPTDLAGTWYI